MPLKRSGTNTYKGLCPFHQEKTPSFHVDASRQMYHCFGCGKGGDVFRFYMDKENVGFSDALHMLASRVGVVIPENSGENSDPAEGRRRADARERLYRVNEDFCCFFERTLLGNPDSPPTQYLIKRGIPRDVAEKFRIGAAPGCVDRLSRIRAFARLYRRGARYLRNRPPQRGDREALRPLQGAAHLCDHERTGQGCRVFGPLARSQAARPANTSIRRRARCSRRGICFMRCRWRAR